ncbi:hypothetical protein IMG5_189430 [Ichthyophthirius multifiliis]|uniref:DNA replication complex GINS protein PSF3 N-terminal domain-containing protein n=1 Tax=Ichthyophthirius multifiliis TaxID=5932 RepID=G0R431_ICHMU|nr:hypothetical protein IMG5_189430 [Ichthyophthirius multifiliis]EGR27770.1 hypothetical protein IMG5_189430 [Ichthyophthirius multifiliis]|eukprot:XP_004026837.1 hypothetical protein IMG5_189430 [Ichthyophthirius multifiliis]
MSYYDIDQIIFEEEKINIKFNQEILKIGFLDLHLEYSDGKDIQKDTILEVPFWLAQQLNEQLQINEEQEDSDSVLTLEVPLIFRPQFQQSLIADPQFINLREKSFYFYEFGIRIGLYFKDYKLFDVLLHVFETRVKSFARQSFYLVIEDCANMILKMTHKEIELFNQGRNQATKLRKWKSEGLKNGHYDRVLNKLKGIKAN